MEQMWNRTAGALLLGALLCLYSASAFGPKNITRTAGTDNEYIRCHTYPIDATPFWKINGIIYYYSEVPPPFVVLLDGREIVIPVIDLSLNQTSFQCFIPSSPGGDLISSSIGVLTVVDNVHSQVTRYSNISRSKLAISHKKLYFSRSSLTLAWRTINSEGCICYDLIVRYDCDANSQSEVVLNKTKDNNAILRRGLLSNSAYFSITSYNEEGDLCEGQYLKQFEFSTGIVTEYLQLCMTDHFETCLPTCVDGPMLNGLQTLILALPFQPVTSGLEEDLLCPVHPLPGERCVDLLSCNHFRESAYANTITVCRRVNNDSSLEMCVHNVTHEMNGTRLHFFYSDLHCRPSGILQLYESSRTYVKSMQLVVMNPAGTDMTIPSSAPTTNLPPWNTDTTTITLTTTQFSVSLILTFICGLFLGASCSCVVYCSFQKCKGSSHKGEEMTIAVTNNPAYEVVRLTH